MNYFNYIAKRLTLDDLKILGILYDSDATATFKAKSRKEVCKESQLTEASSRKTLNRLEAIGFIETVKGSKSHKLFLTEFGMEGLQKSLEEEGADI